MGHRTSPRGKMDFPGRDTRQDGYIAVVTILLLLALIGTGLGYLKWSADESVEFKRQHAALTAYYLAQSALSQDIIPYLCQMSGTYPTINMVGTATSINYEMPEGMDGNYEWRAEYITSQSSQTAYGQTKFYNVEVTGKVKYTPFTRYDSDEADEIEVDTTLYIQYNAAQTWGIFMYLTNYEATIFGEKIKFFNGDTLWGRVHSNDEIAVMQSPVFYERVSSCARDFWHGISYNPILTYEPFFGVDPVYFPTSLEDLRNGAASQGRYFPNPGGLYQFRIWFKGRNGVEIWRWPLGIPFVDTLAILMASYGVLEDAGIFVEGQTEVLGTLPNTVPGSPGTDYGVEGRLSIGSAGDMWLLDNIRYVDSNPSNGYMDSSTTNMLGIMSEANVLIRNTWENGRDNGTVTNNDWREDIIINGGIVALGQSFSFEDQNDVITAYGGTLPAWYYSNGPTPDERGQIHLWGQVSQFRRGYVHRSNHNGSGYLKDYHYDYRFYWDPPPFYPYLDDNYGIDRMIVAWGAGPSPAIFTEEEPEPGANP